MKNNTNKIDLQETLSILNSVQRVLSHIINYCAEQRTLNFLKSKNAPFNYDRLDIYQTCLINIESSWTLFLCKVNQLMECLHATNKPYCFDDITTNNPFILWNYFFINQKHWNIYNVDDLKQDKKKIFESINIEYNDLLKKNKNEIINSSPFVNIPKKYFDQAIKKYETNINQNEIDLLKRRIKNKDIFTLSNEDADKLNQSIKQNKIEFAPPVLNKKLSLTEINDLSVQKALKLLSFFRSLQYEIWYEENGHSKTKFFTHKNFINNLWKYWTNNKLLDNIKEK